MEQRTKIILGIIGAVLLALVVTSIIFLRSQNAGSLEPLATPSPTATTRPATPPTGGLTKEEQAVKDEVGRLEKTLPQDISQTWTPEFRKTMEARRALTSATP